MSGQDDPYSRIYWRVKDDPRFEHAYGCDTCWSAYTRLLIDAEASYPSSASLPRSLKAHARAQLLGAGIIELRPHECFVVHGLQNERERRAVQARAAASARWNPRNADAMPPHSGRNADPMLTKPSLAEPIQAEPSHARTREEPPPPDLRCEPALDAYQRFYPSPTREALRFLDELTAEHGQEWTARAIGQAGMDGGKDKLLSRAKTLLILWARQAEQDEARAERERLAEKRAPLRRQPKPEETSEERARAEEAFALLRTQMAEMGLPGSRNGKMPALDVELEEPFV